ncbi:hypothetical protein KGP26_15225 [Serratia sp. JSRIV002]|uniref:Rap1a/Tai family immunity protein n=1 Tax=Serratia sp. JSRIV002 TaxID=2831894 RepID=UPI001CC11142|nr:Rap1a/Tai family immunity protein [Serratia sp. JSRIV002]UAN49152.1 hypothetical protein KGP26_15225 [Serratia sp. JSRIV002]
MKFVIGTLLLAAFSVSADMRELQTGNDLLYNIQQGKKGDDFSATYIRGYSRGVTDSLMLIGSLCPPDGVDMVQYTDIVEKYIINNPESRSEASVLLTFLAVGKAFPCKKKS